MQENSAKRNAKPEDVAQRAAESEINARLTEHLKTNAIKADRAAPASDRLPQRGFVAEAFALAGLVGLMIVAYVYASLVGTEA